MNLLNRLPLSRAARTLLDPYAIIPFVVASICLSVMANAVYDGIKLIAPEWARQPFVIFVGFAVLLLLMVFWLAWRLSRQMPDFEIDDVTPEKHRGLVLLVSQLEMCEFAIRFHRPVLEQVWLICSAETRPLADQLVKTFTDLKMSILDPIPEVNDPVPFCRLVRHIYRSSIPAHWNSNDIISDCTGMTKPATIGMVLGCVGRDRPVQYTRGHYNSQRKVVEPLAPVELKFDWTGISRTLPLATEAQKSS